LVIVTDLPAPGFFDVDPNDSESAPTSGFEYHLAVEIADRLGLEGVEVVNTPFDQILTGAGDFDLALSQLVETPQRQNLDFSVPYLDADQAVVTVAEDSPITSLATTKALRWGAVAASGGNAALADHIRPTTKPALFDGLAAALAALQSDLVDALVLDAPVAVTVTGGTGLRVDGRIPSGMHYAGVFPHRAGGRSARDRDIDMAIEAMVNDGTIRRLLADWPGGDPTALTVLAEGTSR
jgi:polar amino acid transport system substrate-binding protein